MPESSTGDEDVKNTGQETNNDASKTGDSNAPSTDTQAADAKSPIAQDKKDDNQPKDMVSAVRAALTKGKEQSSGSSDEEGEPKKPADPNAKPAEGEEEELGELTEEELNSYKPKTQRRMRQLLGMNEELTAQVEQYKPAAEQYEGIRSYCEKAKLTREDVNTGFEIMNLMKNRPEEAYEKLAPIFRALEAVVGEVLPDDLQKQVMDGKITEEHARELSRLRMKSHFTEARTSEQQEEEEENNRKKAVEILKTECATAVSGWEKSWKASDPDYRVKHTRVMNEIKLALFEAKTNGTLPKNKAEAVALAEKVKKAVEDDMKSLLPRKNSVTPITKVRSATESKPAPKTMLEAVKQAVGQA